MSELFIISLCSTKVILKLTFKHMPSNNKENGLEK